ncbi:lantibiotic dehydratase [Embleya sp. AB8]|uniref:lantibiotic dehydratase n=1 Tax=Embleya sp. AB8 TaxID=3156304 RepID=UPI003C762F75
MVGDLGDLGDEGDLGVLGVYRYVDAALVRFAAYPGGWQVPPWPDLDGNSPADVECWRDWVKRAWAQEAVAEAVELASPVLAARIVALCGGGDASPRQVRRVVVSLVRYLLRMRYRATPFGLFAGVAPVRFGSAVTLRVGSEHRPVARADATWLADVVGRLEACPELLDRIEVVADPTHIVRGGKLVLPFRQAVRADVGPADVTMRHTRAVESVLRAARTPILVADLRARLAAEYPDTPASVRDTLVGELVALRVLLTGLRAPMTVTDATGHVVDLLAAVGAERDTGAAALARQLRGIHGELLRHEQAAPGARRRMRTDLRREMRALSDVVEQPLCVDLRVDSSLVLPAVVGRVAEEAADTLARLGAPSPGSLAWRAYHAAFLERYGIGGAVPLREVVDADVGLGYPAGYRSSRRERPASRLSARDERLLSWAQRAAFDAVDEIALDERAFADLGGPGGAAPSPPADIELCFRIEARSRTELDLGRFDLVVAGASAAAGAAAGRFLDLLDAVDRERMTGIYADLPSGEPGALRVQISSPPLRVVNENVGRTPAVLPQVISLAEHATPGTGLALRDLAVRADADRMYLLSSTDGRVLEPTAVDAVKLTNIAHPLARFLYELPRAHTQLAAFHWGAARKLPFLPRLRHGRVVVSTARWRLEARDLAAPDASWEQWTRTLTAWRARFRAPETVRLGDADQRLRLDLTEKAHAQLLREHLNRVGHATLDEAPDTSAYGWCDGRPHEIALALAAVRQPTARRSNHGHGPGPVIIGGPGHLPGASGSAWAYAKLYGHPDRQTEILTAHLPALWARWDVAPRWWFVRSSGPHPHLRLWIRLRDAGVDADADADADTDVFGPTARRVGDWVADLRALGLLGGMQWDTYHPEVGRYGPGAAMAAAEEVFAADSAAALVQLGVRGTDPQALTAAGFVDLVTSFSGDTGAGMRGLVETLDRTSSPASARSVHDEAIRLADPREDHAALRAIPGGAEVVARWARRRAALAAYRELLHATGQITPESVTPALLHMHHNRVFGIDEDCEHTCRRLARSAALSWLARQEGSHRQPGRPTGCHR